MRLFNDSVVAGTSLLQGRRFVRALVLLSSAMALVAVNATAANAATARKPDPDATLVYMQGKSVATNWDVHKTSAGLGDFDVHSLVYDKLFDETPDGTGVVPRLAQSYKI